MVFSFTLKNLDLQVHILAFIQFLFRTRKSDQGSKNPVIFESKFTQYKKTFFFNLLWYASSIA
jgi:hypothetical protein